MANAYGTGSGVSFQRADYTEANEQWTTVDDCISGQAAIKKKGDIYLPLPSSDKSTQAQSRYLAYLTRAVFYNYTSRTSEGMLGTAFAKGVTFEGPSELEYLKEDVNGTSEDLIQQAKRVLTGTAAHGRYGLLAEFPTVEGTKSKADQQRLGIRATIQAYAATSIINWGYSKVGVEVKLSLVVLYETITQKVAGNDFELELINQWRVLKLQDGLYVQEIWQSKAESADQTNTQQNTVAGENNNAKLISTFEPRLGSGSRLDYIPFQFVGSLNNDGVIDKSLLIDIANINLAHYRNSADYENSTFQCSQAQPVMSGLTQTWVDENYPNGVTLGSGVVLMGPDGFEYSVVQAAETEQSMRAMEHKEKQIIAIGGQLITPDSFDTATEAVINNAADKSSLQTVIDNVEDAYQTVLGWVAEFMKAQGDVEFSINSNLSEIMATPQMVQAVVQAWQGGALGLTAKNDWLRNAGLTDQTDEEIEADIEEDTTGLGLSDAE